MSGEPLLGDRYGTVGLVINAPAVFAREDFMAWLNDAPDYRREWTRRAVFTWHDRSQDEAGEYSDVVVLVDANREGDGSDMPTAVWDAICDAVYEEYGPDLASAKGASVPVRLTNLSA